MTLSVKAGGSWRPAIPWVKAGGTWRKCTAVFVKAGGAWRQVYSTVASIFVVSPLSAGNNNLDLPIGSSGASQIVLRSDGSIFGNSDYSGPTQYLNTVGAGNGNGFWVRCTVVSGALSGASDPTNTWLQLSSNRQWQRSAGTNGGGSVQFTLDFSTDAAGTSIVCSSTNWRVTYGHS